ncbi:MAG TPA: hypothetical protein ENN09_06660 [Planctomycetes bacterium]|nr:hypothetical protein [Planctomycetota bacterium]
MSAAEGDAAPLPPELASFAPADTFSLPEDFTPFAIPVESGYSNYVSVGGRAGGFLPVKLTDRLYDGFVNWDLTVGYKYYGAPLPSFGAIFRDEFVHYPGYVGAVVTLGESSDSSLRRIVLQAAKPWRKEGLYLVGEAGFSALGDGIPFAFNHQIALYYYLLDLPLRAGVIYKGRSADHDEWATGRWDGLEFVGEFYGINRTMLSVSYAVTLSSEDDVDNDIVFEAHYFPFNEYYFRFKHDQTFFPGGWEYVMSLGIGYVHSNRLTVTFDFDAHNASCSPEISFSASMSLAFRY